ncbi:cobalt-precorrin-6A reductase [Roseinatronobacter alkalisoli]|uniref:Cobalt-precorrin-6A reductase n=1 Tax=Roseinatronobacter alkalisoli TaxID=3028235 RepID=A0ABT5TA22_9RHOB|nr:cobalt-precorrin-6A reductase [Roseinatronobacter sp. HJB301]MDD7970788.1 cobalt-precorrin-6A reductase [Roseinatronobacter sp. HJB301]
MPNILVLGGTIEATRLVADLARAGLPTTLSYAGRVARPKPQPVPVRVGGFGGADGLARYLRENHITHLVDATHPFADTISRNALHAATLADTPLLALTRPPWTARDGDQWTHVPDIPAAVAALGMPRRNIMLALGRMHLAAFATQPQHRYLLRLVDPPQTPPPLPDHHIIIDRGPFDAVADAALMQAHDISLIVAKNAGGTGALAKLTAARQLQIPVLMIDRPALPERAQTQDIATVLDWVRV